jgi:hypothetical protein
MCYTFFCWTWIDNRNIQVYAVESHAKPSVSCLSELLPGILLAMPTSFSPLLTGALVNLIDAPTLRQLWSL